MSEAPVRAVKPLLSQAEAMVQLTRRSWFSFRKPELRRLELIYLPYYFFHLCIPHPAGKTTPTGSVDALTGTFALVDAPALEFVGPANGKNIGFRISLIEAEKICRDEYRNMLLGHALRQKESIVLEAVQSVGAVYFPYWIAYFKIGTKYDFSALDAVSGKPAGIKMRQVFVAALTTE